MIVERFHLHQHSKVVEIASNDGYLLRNFVERGIPVLGIEPAANVAEVVTKNGIQTRVAFFGEKTAQALTQDAWSADLIIGNNVLAHVPDLNDFVAGLKILLKPTALITMEFPHLLQLMEDNQFDTIYHEHYSYLSLLSVKRIFASHGLILFDVDELATHGGSLRIYVRHAEDGSRPVGQKIRDLRKREAEAGLAGLDSYHSFNEKVKEWQYPTITSCTHI